MRRQRFYNRHGISQNPTEGERRLLRALWRADDAKGRIHHAASGAGLLRDRIRELESENTSLRALIVPTEEIPTVSDRTHV